MTLDDDAKTQTNKHNRELLTNFFQKNFEISKHERSSLRRHGSHFKLLKN